MSSDIDTALILDDPHGSFVKALDKDLCDNSSLQLVAGFVTRSGISILSQYLKSKNIHLKNMIFGGANLDALRALSELKSQMKLSNEVIRFHPGKISGGSSKGLFRPMLHSKIYFIESSSGTVTYVGSHNLTDFALMGHNCEAALRISGESSNPVFRKIRRHIDQLVREALPFEEDLISAYAWINRQFLQSMTDGPELDKSISEETVLIIVARYDRHLELPRPGDALYFEVGAYSLLYKQTKQDQRLHIYLLDAPSEHISPEQGTVELIRSSFASFEAKITGKNLTGKEGSLGIATTTQRRKPDWILTEIDSTPTLLKESNIPEATKSAQIYAIFEDEKPTDFEYFETNEGFSFELIPDKGSARTARELMGGLSLEKTEGTIEEIPLEVKKTTQDLDVPWFAVKMIRPIKLERAIKFAQVGQAQVFSIHYLRKHKNEFDQTNVRDLGITNDLAQKKENQEPSV